MDDNRPMRDFWWFARRLFRRKTEVALLLLGATISAGLPQGGNTSGRVTVVVRPEHADLVKRGEKADLWGKLETVVYFGTDTHYHVLLDGGEPFIIRQQNSHGGGTGHAVGDAVGVALEPNSAQVVRD